MSEIKQRITNEQAKFWADSIHVCKETNYLAADLLEARELIEKQKAIIKEMRGIICRYVKLDTMFEAHDNLNRNATSILEKSKEYA